MKYLNKYENFIIEGLSKNHPIQELREKEKLGIVLLGAPGSGKSTFAREIILPNNRNSKVFSTDEISKLYTKDPNVYHVGSAELNIQYLKNYIKTGQNFIYDTTGGNESAVFEVCKSANKEGYKIIFVLILVDLPTAKGQNISRGKLGGHQVDEDYIDYVYSTQNQSTKNFIKLLKHESFYIVLNNSGKYKYFKHVGNKMLKRKIDKYVPMSESQEYTPLSNEDYWINKTEIVSEPFTEYERKLVCDVFESRKCSKMHKNYWKFWPDPNLRTLESSISVEMRSLDGNILCSIHIEKKTDEWFLSKVVRHVNSTPATYYKSDQIDGLINLLESISLDLEKVYNDYLIKKFNESQDQELLDLLNNLNHKMRGFIRVGTPDEIYEDYFLELKESENFRVIINKGNGFVTNIDIDGMVDDNIIESEFNRILNKMKMIKERLNKQFNFNCHFMIYLNGRPQQDLNDKTHKNDDYNFKGIGSNKRGYDKDFYYKDQSEIDQWARTTKPFPDDKVAISIKFFIV